jgi:hypothetical protein
MLDFVLYYLSLVHVTAASMNSVTEVLHKSG